jgi:hypothetical protein
VNRDERDEALDAALRALGEDVRITHSKAELDEVSATVLARMDRQKPVRERAGDQPVASMPVRPATLAGTAAAGPLRAVWLSIIIAASVLVGAVAGALAWISGSTAATAVAAASGAFAATTLLVVRVMHLVGGRQDAE